MKAHVWVVGFDWRIKLAGVGNLAFGWGGGIELGFWSRTVCDEQLDLPLAAVAGAPFFVTIITKTFLSSEGHFLRCSLHEWRLWSGFRHCEGIGIWLGVVGLVLGRPMIT